MKKEKLWNKTCKMASRCHFKEQQLNYDATLEYYNNVVILYWKRRIAGIYYTLTGTLYVFEYLSHQCYKAINIATNILKASRITYLYRRSDGVIEKGLNGFVNSYKLTAKEFRNVENYDFTSYIPNSIFDGE